MILYHLEVVNKTEHGLTYCYSKKRYGQKIIVCKASTLRLDNKNSTQLCFQLLLWLALKRHKSRLAEKSWFNKVLFRSKYTNKMHVLYQKNQTHAIYIYHFFLLIWYKLYKTYNSLNHDVFQTYTSTLMSLIYSGLAVWCYWYNIASTTTGNSSSCAWWWKCSSNYRSWCWQAGMTYLGDGFKGNICIKVLVL